jgi:Fe-Mn family superoxide dismutase
MKEERIFYLFIEGFMKKLCLGFVCLLGALTAQEPAFVVRDFSSLLEMPGWNRDLLLMHFRLYEGYVKNTNLLLEELSKMDKKSYDFGAIKRRLAWEWDGMRLHELYFENLGKHDAESLESSLQKQIQKDFGSMDAWKADFVATGMSRGIGWVILYKDKLSSKLCNAWINEHDVGHLVLGDPLLIMDVFEHAYITQFSLDRSKYIDLFFQSIDWSVVNQRWRSSQGVGE